MAEEGYMKVGRGGAGNFYSRKDIQDVRHPHPLFTDKDILISI